MTQSSVESTSSNDSPVVDAPATKSGAERGYDEMWAGGWICLLVTVYLCGAFLNSLMRWLAFGALWDLTGLALSGVLAWAGYYWTISESAIQPFGKRVASAICLLAAWALVFPALMWSCGFQ